MSRRQIVRIIFLSFLIIVTVLVTVVAFVGSSDNDILIKDEYLDYNNDWLVNGKEVDLPCVARGLVVMEKKLPNIYQDRVLVVQCFYKKADVYIGDKHVVSSKPNIFLGHETNVGHNELTIPLRVYDAGRPIRIEIDVQNSVYTRRISDAFIYTRSGRLSYLIIKNLFSLTLVPAFFVSGIIEMFIALVYAIKKRKMRARYSLLTLFYTGLFSVVASIWVICEARVLTAIFGHATAYAILNDVFFMLMPLSFFGLLRAIVNKETPIETGIMHLLGTVAILTIIICTTGIVDWNFTEYVGQAMVFIVFIHVVYITVKYGFTEKNRADRTAVIIGNMIFVIMCITALVCYMFGISQNYLAFVIAGLMIYASMQVFLAIHKIGISIEEEEILATVTEYAYKDELTGLSNRRYFYSKFDELAKGKIHDDMCLINIDANRLKYYNDTLGHNAGDELLKAVAECLNGVFAYKEGTIISRMGGDEFAVLIKADKMILEERIYQFRRLLADYKGANVSNLSVAIGYVRAGDHPGATLEELSMLADDEMYKDKRKFYDESGIDRRKR